MTASQIESISRLVFEDKQEVNCSILAKTLGIHIDEAKGALKKFATSNESKVIVEYMVSNESAGNDTDTRMVIVTKDELESAKSQYKNSTVHPYSVRALDSSDNDSVLNFEKFLINGDDFESVQKFGHILNPQITCRPDRRTVVNTKPNPPKVFEKPAPKPPMSKLFKKEPESNVKKVKKEEPEEDIKFEDEEIEDMDFGEKLVPKMEPQSKIEALKEINSTRSSPRKRASNKNDDSEDEIDGDVIKKKRKRIIIDDSDDEDGEFMTTTLKEESKEEEIKKVEEEKKKDEKKKKEEEKPKKTPPAAKGKGMPVKGQKSIMSFFKKTA